LTKQQKTYLLLTAVLIIWGLIGYQIFNQLSPKEEHTEMVVHQKYQPKAIKKVVSYELKNNYRDPFLGKLPASTKAIAQKKPKKEKKKNTKKKKFPRVVYNGIVEGASQLFVITINGNQENYTINQTINDITLIDGNDTEITLSFNDEEKTFPIQ